MDTRHAQDATHSVLDAIDILRRGEEAWIHRWGRRYGGRLARHDAENEARRVLTRMGDAILEDRTADLPPEVFRFLETEQQPQNLFFSLSDAMVRRLWARHRITYRIDETMWEELAEADDTDTFPSDVFDYLPHPNPYISFPTPIIVDHGGPHIMHVSGAFVVGHRTLAEPGTGHPAHLQTLLNTHCSTHSPDSTGLGLLFYGPMYDRNGRRRLLRTADGGTCGDAMGTRVNLDFGGASTATLAELNDRIMRRFNPDAYDAELRGGPHATVEAVMRRVLPALVYLCAENADFDRPTTTAAGRAARVRTPAGARPAKPPKVVPVGFRIGAELRAARARAAAVDPSAATGRTLAPHVRRAHFHTFRFGKGRTQRRVKWLPPIPINTGGVDAEQVTVIPA